VTESTRETVRLSREAHARAERYRASHTRGYVCVLHCPGRMGHTSCTPARRNRERDAGDATFTTTGKVGHDDGQVGRAAVVQGVVSRFVVSHASRTNAGSLY